MPIPDDVRAAFEQSLEREAQAFEKEMIGFIRSGSTDTIEDLRERILQAAIGGINDALRERLPGKHRQKDHAGKGM